MFSELKPTAVWAHFATLCRIPRQSKQEAALRDHLRDWAAACGLPTQVDDAGNLIIRKPASPGLERVPGMVLQGHLDMVCQKNSDSPHDFSRDPIKPVLRDGDLVAEDTTLGADNGIGVAMILAVLEDTSLTHGPIEALFTVDEEAGMGGAQGLAPGVLQGSVMLNLDTEEWGEFYLGCAGGMDVNVSRPAQARPLPAGHEAWRLSLRGLRGGHSGVNIHEERGNAIKLLVRVLHGLAGRYPMLLSELRGGTARNALPREAFATVALPAGHGTELADDMAHWQSLLSHELAGVESGLQLSAQATQATHVLSPQDQTIWLNSLHASPHGVRRMSQRVPGVVETSNNLGMVDLKPDGGSCNFMVRSLLDSGSQALADEIVSLWALSGTAAESNGQYPGWTPNPDSALLKLCQQVYRSEFKAESSVQVIHAGLECGIIAAKYPGLDIVSFGPTIRGAHAPGESVDVASVTRTWQLLTAILAAHA
ncbi:aminoacyl-histidine dipeptidase [Aquabacterium sp. CECT 9606]|uniref:aminoacyl-histidine dipeptidase n=1 Tax=Aquabacterium sp. CECT 9606 TaxID=2845822 RepID=UPI001E4DBCBB|nr:aminoacyl-histidine dipeptidase [Aquabacterium sp. CECT 9606]CAH0353682.1 Cytosol non-specific dipeptidase [Aquabacterium sp. CECT 9606]